MPAKRTCSVHKAPVFQANEMLNCLRITDLPQVAGLLYPTELVFTGEYPVPYAWAELLYRRLGAPGKFCRLGNLSEWHVE